MLYDDVHTLLSLSLLICLPEGQAIEPQSGPVQNLVYNHHSPKHNHTEHNDQRRLVQLPRPFNLSVVSVPGQYRPH